MKARASLFRTALVLLLSIGALWPAGASPLRQADVPDSAKFVIHVDCDHLRSSSFGPPLLKKLEGPQTQSDFATIQEATGLDIQKQVRGITLCLMDLKQHTWLLLIDADMEPSRVRGALEKKQAVGKVLHHRHLVFHSTADQGKDWFLAVHDRGVVVASETEAEVAAELDRLDADSKQPQASPWAGLAKGGYIATVGCGPQAFGKDLPMVKALQSGRLNLSESQGKTQAELTLEMGGADSASQLLLIAKGAAAGLKLQSQQPELAELADAITWEQEGTAVRAKAVLPSKDVLAALLKALAPKASAGADGGHEPARPR